MVTESESYIQVIEYLTEHLSLFEKSNEPAVESTSILEVIEMELSEQIINVCAQNPDLTFNQRNAVIREVDAIVYDLQEILSGVIDNPVTLAQMEFVREFAGIIKNIFDAEIHAMLAQPEQE